ncbi:protein-glutamate O-methyltransferase CheR [Leptolyngbya sp. FACHB-671]|uniref:protein-glutamate O-methyltransferase CheR n=1 Tax=Leptolyngbya sp. FACHB-671 TaxID=2692812 RepID=UPI001687FA01|nr:protein-glutamate O-methyltransferase CheR [Leptolyngbya sp. FACHB-671]
MSPTEPLSAERREAFVRLIAKHTGIEIRARDQANLSTKISSRMKALKLDSSTAYYQLLESSNADSHQEWLDLVTLLTNGESYFFRDTEQFSLLRNQILPELIQQNQDSKTIRICSAGCSSGEEPYSIAILLKELIPDLEQWNLLILGVDINQLALEKAKKAIYSPWSFRNVDPDVKQQYFQLIHDRYKLDQSIKEMVNFQILNLIKDEFPQQDSELRDMDLIICRNVFIYFERAAIAKVISKFHRTLKPLGYLLTGHAELSNQNLNPFQIKVFTESLIYQRTANDSTTASLSSTLDEQQSYYPENLSSDTDDDLGDNPHVGRSIRMQQIALNLLRQLPPDTTIQKLGNLTAAELILQLETELKSLDQELS